MANEGGDLVVNTPKPLNALLSIPGSSFAWSINPFTAVVLFENDH